MILSLYFYDIEHCFLLRLAIHRLEIHIVTNYTTYEEIIIFIRIEINLTNFYLEYFL